MAETKYGEELVHGVHRRRNAGGTSVLRVHYTADPDRDPKVSPQWKATERKKYSSQGAWDREQEIRATAGGGELLFQQVLTQYAEKIIITDPSWVPNPRWAPLAGFDHGKANPTAGLVARVDFTGIIYFTGEYYMPGMSPLQHVPNLRKLPGFFESEFAFADPSIFIKNQAQGDGSFKSISQLYTDAGLTHLVQGKNPEIAGLERILAHWLNLEEREPTIRIVCRIPFDRPQHGLFPHDCPNLLWELMRARREMLTAVQLMRKNPTEAVVDKDNHLRDAMKYMVASLPEPTNIPLADRIAERVKDMDPLNAFIVSKKMQSEEPDGDGLQITGGVAARRHGPSAPRRRPGPL